MKKLLALMLAAALALSLVACGGGSGAGDNNTPSTESGDTTSTDTPNTPSGGEKTKEEMLANGQRIRARLKIVNIPKRRLFFRHTLPIFLGIHQVFLRQIGFVWRKNLSLLGIFPIFKQRLGLV